MMSREDGDRRNVVSADDITALTGDRLRGRLAELAVEEIRQIENAPLRFGLKPNEHKAMNIAFPPDASSAGSVPAQPCASISTDRDGVTQAVPDGGQGGWDVSGV